jgi:uncharacterized protein
VYGVAPGAGAASSLAPPPASTTEAAIPAAPTEHVTDTVGFLSDGARLEIDARLTAFEKRSGNQVLLWIGRSTGAAPIEDWAVRAFAAWRVGRKGLDEGVVLFIMNDDRKLRIEVGYGLEDRLPDARAATMIRERIIPRIQAGDRDGAARAGIGAILAALGDSGADAGAGAANQLDGVPSDPPKLSYLQMAVIALLGLLVLGFVITHPGLAILFLSTLASGRGGGGGGGRSDGFGGGGSSGGGGRSGGGGASGGW